MGSVSRLVGNRATQDAFLKSQGKFLCHLHVPFSYIFLTPKNYKSRVIFVSFTDANETREMYLKSDNVEIRTGIETEDITNELFNTFSKRYQEGLEKMTGSSFTFERIDLLEYHLHKTSLNRGSSYIKSPEWLKNKGVTINPKNTKNNKCFQYAIIAALNHQNIDHHPERISKLRPFIDNYDWTEIEFPAHSKDWRKFECNNKTIALNVLCVSYNDRQEEVNDEGNEFDGTKYIRHAYTSKHNKKRDTQVNLLMIENDEGNWHYLAITTISGLLRGITLRNNGNFYCLNCFHSYSTENKLRKHEKICCDHKFCFLKMPDPDNNILKSKPGKKSLKHAFVVYADLECLLLKINTCDSNPNKSHTIAKALHKPSGYSLVTCS